MLRKVKVGAPFTHNCNMGLRREEILNVKVKLIELIY